MSQKMQKKKHPSLIRKIIIGYLAFAIMAIICIFSLSSTIFYNVFLNLVSSDMKTAGKDFIKIYNTDENDFDALKTCADITGYTIWIIDENNIITFDNKGELTNTYIDDFNIEDFDDSYTTGYFYDLLQKKSISVAIPIKDAKAYCILHKETSRIYTMSDNFIYISLIFYGIILAFSLIVFIIVILFVYRPIKNISVVASEFAKGNFSKEDIAITSLDEIGHLAQSLNKMKNQLNENEEYQKKFISNISHDFRSPLTSIKGYLQAILDGTIPKDNTEKYLNIVLSETERLTELSNELINLNSWNASSLKLEWEDFVITQSIDSLVEIFDGRCAEKNIHMEVTYPRQFMVYADKKKIEQVLYNLVDNAIKFSPSGGKIDIILDTADDKVITTIRDYGVGIPSDSIDKIWNRFYKTDQSRGLDKTGSGIGLSIVKEVLLSHGEDITVESNESQGTAFTFTLKKSKRQMK